MMFKDDEKQCLLMTSRKSIYSGLVKNRAFAPDLSDYPFSLRESLASFVTLKINGQLHGCIGTTSPVSPLIIGVADNAYAAAFHDPRFPALTEEKYEKINISISVLGPASEIQFSSEEQIIAQLQPGIDGLIIQQGERRATFLPAVWESLPSAEDFILHLKQKAGIAVKTLPERAWRYRTETIEDG